jgi:hypothetical protein
VGLLSALFGWSAPADDDPDDDGGEVLVCERCGTTEDVQVDLDPYALEVNDDRQEMALCSGCYQERLWDS